MRPPARLQAAIEILDAVIAAAAGNGAAADTIAARYFRDRRYAGSGDRTAIRALVYAGIRFTAERPESGRALMLGLAATARPDLLPLFDGSAHAPATPAPTEPKSRPSLYPAWLQPELARRFPTGFEAELQALVDRAPLDIRVNSQRANAADVAAQLAAAPIPGLPGGLRLAAARSLQSHPLLLDGSIEVQDAGSQLVVQMAAAGAETVVDLCAGAGGKTLALAAAMAGRGRLIATDVNRARLQAMTPRLQRARVADGVERRLLNPGAELAALADVRGQADLVLVDAPCSGSGTWRRNPELRWRLDQPALARLHAVQARLIGLATELLRPGGRLVYAVCSVLPSEGRQQATDATARLSLRLEVARELSPASDGTDGFFIARFGKIC